MLVTFLSALVLALVHVFAGRLWHNRPGEGRDPILSMAGGVSVAFVFVLLLPELSALEETVDEAVEGIAGEGFDVLDRHVWLLSLLGLTAFYALDARVRQSSGKGGGGEAGEGTEHSVALLSFVAYSGYSAVIGYLLSLEEASPAVRTVLFSLAIGVHFLVVDHAMRGHHPDHYHRVGRWMLASALLLGWTAGALVDVPDVAVGLLLAFVAGAIILIVLKEELPEERRGNVGYFVAGAVGYTFLLLLVL